MVGDHRPDQVEAGRFCEGVFRLLQHLAGIAPTPLGKPLPKLPVLLRTLENGEADDTVRLTIPRVLAGAYDLRSKRDSVHLGGDVDVNFMDSSFTVATCDWVMAELVRLLHDFPPEQAQVIVDGLVRRQIPLVWSAADGRKLVLTASLPLRDEILILLYHGRATIEDLHSWIPGNKRNQIRARCSDLTEERMIVAVARGCFEVTPLGETAAESLILTHQVASHARAS